MKPQLLKVPVLSNCSFSIRQDTAPFFYNRWHYHPEVELVYIEQGTGTQFVGDSIQSFQPGDILLIGRDLPHYWRCDDAYFENRHDLYAQAVVVHFRENFWGDAFLQLPENRTIVQLLSKAKQGIRLRDQTREDVKLVLLRMLTESGTSRIVSLIQILSAIASSTNCELLSLSNYSTQFDEADTDRINQIYVYSLAHFQRKITLKEVAAVANISPHSFCRYFKARSRKSYSQFLLELRVHHACKLLIENRMSISQICYESGFNQFSGFNKYFKQIMGKTPISYRKTFRRE
ncbi:AraC family transcriptional regulator [Spirosoma koreense]